MRKPVHNKRSVILLSIVLMLLLFLVAALLDSRFRLETDRFEITDPDLPAVFDGFRVVQLSDLHEREFGPDNARLVAAVTREAPDLIVLTGDFVDSTAGIPVALTLAEQLLELAPVYFVSGNHDWASGEMESLRTHLEMIGVTVLDNKWETLKRDGASIVLCGVEDPNGYADSPHPDAVVASVRAQYPEEFLLLVGHRNYWPDAYPALDADLILCGHGHGGVIRLPIVGGLLGSGNVWLPDYTAGLYTGTTYRMLVSRGLGGGMQMPRLFNSPQVVSVTLRAA